jgi:hypothetical protein
MLHQIEVPMPTRGSAQQWNPETPEYAPAVKVKMKMII